MHMSLRRRPSTANPEGYQYYDHFSTSSNSPPSSPTTGPTRARTFSEVTRAYNYKSSPFSSPQHFDMKRLLSKPAPPYARIEGHGSGSESDPTALSEPGREERGEKKERTRKSGLPPGLSKSTSSIDIHLVSNMESTVLLDMNIGPNPSTKSVPDVDSVPSNMFQPIPPAKRTRNVLRRRPSNPTLSNSNRSPVTTTSPPSPPSSSSSTPLMTATTHTAAMTSTPPSGSAPSHGTADIRHAHHIPSRTTNADATFGLDGIRDPQPNEHTRRPGDNRQRDGHENQHRHRSRSQSRNLPGSGSRGSHLTPAGAVVEAYKWLEEARLSGASKGSCSPSGSASGERRKGDRINPGEAKVGEANAKTGEADKEDELAPYYTVVGSSSERVKAVNDRWEAGYQWEPTGLGRRSQSTGREADGSGNVNKPGLAKTLTRKVSGRWRKGGANSGETGDDAGKGMQTESERGRVGLQERKVGKSSNAGEGENLKNQRSLRVSIDNFADSTAEQTHSGIVPAEPEVEVDPTLRPPLKSRKSEPSGSGSKIWKLVKRISTSGLRDKYRDTDEPPPVPALPKDYQSTSTASGSRKISSTDPVYRQDQQIGSSLPSTPPGGKSRFIQRSTSAGLTGTPPIRRKSSVADTGARSKKPSLSSPITNSASPIPARTNKSSPSSSSTSNSYHTPNLQRTAITPSSSPISSDVSARFFTRPSTRSSTSSLSGDDNAPPMPMSPMKILVGQHIIPPSELSHRMHTDENTNEAIPVSHSLPVTSGSRPKLEQSGGLQMSDDWMIRHTPTVELMPLPVPPRRSAPRPFVRRNSSDSDQLRSNSPVIPAFSTANPINTFGPSSRRMSADSRKASLPSRLVDPVSSLPLITTPPRPMRSSQRPLPRPRTSQSQSMPTSSSIFSLRKRRELPDFQPSSTTENLEANRRSTGGHSNTSVLTMRPPLRRRSSSVISELHSPARWKEMGEDERRALTEQEKADRWDDLLERSARAGGTLHLGAGGGEDGLSSDLLQFSEYSESS